MLTQRSINYQKKHKRYYIIETQFRSAVKGDSFADKLRFPSKKRFRMLIIGMCLTAVSLYLILFFGGFDFLSEVFG
jgi:hypothetical protein